MKIVTVRGFGKYGKAHKRKHHKKGMGAHTAHQAAFSRAAKECKGRPLKAYRACVASKLS